MVSKKSRILDGVQGRDFVFGLGAGLVVALTAGLLNAGCTVATNDPGKCGGGGAMAVEENGRELNGRYINGRYINGRYINGRYINGRYINGRYINGRYINGRYINGPDLHGTIVSAGKLQGELADGTNVIGVEAVSGSLAVRTTDGALVSGDKLVGLVLRQTMDDGLPVEYRVRGLHQHADPALADVVLYDVDQSIGAGGFESLCREGTAAIALSGRWDGSQGNPTSGAHIDEAGTVTLACQGYALAKCVEMGYAPWRQAEDGSDRTMADHHQACTRMIRADYCGDGVTHTYDGTIINVWDGLPQQVQAREECIEGGYFEAQWGTDGARCVSQVRWDAPPADCVGAECQGAAQYIQDHCPEVLTNCAPELASDPTGFVSADASTLLMNEAFEK